MANDFEDLSTRVNPETLASLRQLAEKEGLPLEALVEEALRDLLEKRRLGRPRNDVMEAYRRSYARYGELYKKLAL